MARLPPPEELTAMNPSIKPYGSWLSPITSDLIVAESIGLGDVMLDGDDVYWIEGRPREAGRNVIVRCSGGGREDVNPPPFNARTRVHEYGGGAAAVDRGAVYYSGFADQRLYRQDRGAAAPVPITPPPPPDPSRPGLGFRYADGLIDRPRNRWIGVREEHAAGGDPHQPVNTLVDIDLATGGTGRVLAQGNDFYSSPRLSPDGGRLAWLTWNHPDMPWVGTELWVAGCGPDGSLTGARRVAGGRTESVFQPEWSPDGRLHFISDRSGWWNLYRLEEDAGNAVVVRPLCPMAAEFGQPQWNFGMSTYAFADADRLVCSYSQNGTERLALLDMRSLALTPFDLPYTDFSSVRASGDRVAFRAGSPADPACIVLLHLGTGETEVLQSAMPAASKPELRRCFSVARHVEFPTEDGKTAHGFYYPPSNPDYAAPEGEKPPLVVKCHGGPTSSASGALDLRIQYWTSRGIAVLDVDYGGSTGYGREYRDRLHLRWGIVDVDDCVNGAKYLVGQGLADGARAVITGGSAGGYTTLAALTFRDFFKGGASYYGVSDASALARDTHKFESRYLDWLIGPYPAQEEVYRERSPADHADRLDRPVIFFQGDEDEIVPPNQTELMVDALRRKGIPVGYLLFTGEQHGFRRGENIKRALDAELYFYASLIFTMGLTF
jgi:dipeptidyl aminopeptidase/acylaminoacyl peptidase